MRSRKSTCLYLDQEVVKTAKQMGLNVSRVSENALMDAIERLNKPKLATGPRSPISVEGRGRDSNPGARLHRPVGYQATSPRPHFPPPTTFAACLFTFSKEQQSVLLADSVLLFLERKKQQQTLVIVFDFYSFPEDDN